jgi:acyl-CoA thioester hydrolase
MVARRQQPERLHETSVELEVPFHHVDALHVVWHGHYAEYFERARTALLRSRGLDLGDPDAPPPQHRLYVIESYCRHGFPLRYGDRFRVSAWFGDIERRIVIHYEITNLTQGRRAAHGYTALGTVDGENRLRLKTPEALIRRIRA